MIDTTTVDKPTGIAAQPPATQMWPVIQKLSATRTAFAHAKDQQSRLDAAVHIADLVEQLRGLAAALLDEVRGP
jgi:hypothetical protein